MEEGKVDPQYKMGFNHGYWIEKGEPKTLVEMLERSPNKEGIYHQALLAGKKEAQREKVRNRIQNIDRGNRSKDNDIGYD